MKVKPSDWKDVSWRSSHVQALYFQQEERIEGHPQVAAMTQSGYYVGTLHVAYKNGSVYRYPGVSRSDYNAIFRAKSVGGALHRLIRVCVPDGIYLGDFKKAAARKE